MDNTDDLGQDWLAEELGEMLDEDLELVVRAEELGFDEFWIGEHHTMKYEPIALPTPRDPECSMNQTAPASSLKCSTLPPAWLTS